MKSYQSHLEENLPELRPVQPTTSTKPPRGLSGLFGKKKKHVHMVAPRGRCVSEKCGPEPMVNQWSALDAAHKVLKQRREKVVMV
jgi:hypothetical protein